VACSDHTVRGFLPSYNAHTNLGILLQAIAVIPVLINLVCLCALVIRGLEARGSR
jgi:hypothetical protein